jgi:NAD(P)-dependent dehydrogenase (short-subunit alcohol dehydrogenase family)
MANRVVAVTGSTSGIGEAVARRLAACGATVVVNSARTATTPASRHGREQLGEFRFLNLVVEEIKTVGGRRQDRQLRQQGRSLSRLMTFGTGRSAGPVLVLDR